MNDKNPPALPTPPSPDMGGRNENRGMDFIDVLVVVGFISLVGGLAALFGPAVAAAIGGGILFVLGIGLAIYKGTR